MTKLLLVFVFFQWANVSLIDITVRAQESGSSGISIPMPSNGLVGSVPSADFSDELYNTLPSIPSASRVSDLLESKDLQTFLATRFNAYGAYGETHEGEIDLDWKNILEELNNNSNSSHSSLSTSDSSEASLTDLTAIDLEYVYAKWKEEQEGSRCEDSACLEKKLKEAFGEIEAEEVETSFGKQILYKIAGRELKTQEDWTWFMQSRGLPIVGLTAYGLYGLYRRRREENERYKETWKRIEAFNDTRDSSPPEDLRTLKEKLESSKQELLETLNTRLEGSKPAVPEWLEEYEGYQIEKIELETTEPQRSIDIENLGKVISGYEKNENRYQTYADNYSKTYSYWEERVYSTEEGMIALKKEEEYIDGLWDRYSLSQKTYKSASYSNNRNKSLIDSFERNVYNHFRTNPEFKVFIGEWKSAGANYRNSQQRIIGEEGLIAGYETLLSLLEKEDDPNTLSTRSNYKTRISEAKERIKGYKEVLEVEQERYKTLEEKINWDLVSEREGLSAFLSYSENKKKEKELVKAHIERGREYNKYSKEYQSVSSSQGYYYKRRNEIKDEVVSLEQRLKSYVSNKNRYKNYSVNYQKKAEDYRKLKEEKEWEETILISEQERLEEARLFETENKEAYELYQASLITWQTQKEEELAAKQKALDEAQAIAESVFDSKQKSEEGWSLGLGEVWQEESAKEKTRNLSEEEVRSSFKIFSHLKGIKRLPKVTQEEYEKAKSDYQEKESVAQKLIERIEDLEYSTRYGQKTGIYADDWEADKAELRIKKSKLPNAFAVLEAARKKWKEIEGNSNYQEESVVQNGSRITSEELKKEKAKEAKKQTLSFLSQLKLHSEGENKEFNGGALEIFGELQDIYKKEDELNHFLKKTENKYDIGFLAERLQVEAELEAIDKKKEEKESYLALYQMYVKKVGILNVSLMDEDWQNIIKKYWENKKQRSDSQFSEALSDKEFYMQNGVTKESYFANKEARLKSLEEKLLNYRKIQNSSLNQSLDWYPEVNHLEKQIKLIIQGKAETSMITKVSNNSGAKLYGYRDYFEVPSRSDSREVELLRKIYHYSRYGEQDCLASCEQELAEYRIFLQDKRAREYDAKYAKNATPNEAYTKAETALANLQPLIEASRIKAAEEAAEKLKINAPRVTGQVHYTDKTKVKSVTYSSIELSVEESSLTADEKTWYKNAINQIKSISPLLTGEPLLEKIQSEFKQIAYSKTKEEIEALEAGLTKRPDIISKARVSEAYSEVHTQESRASQLQNQGESQEKLNKGIQIEIDQLVQQKEKDESMLYYYTTKYPNASVAQKLRDSIARAKTQIAEKIEDLNIGKAELEKILSNQGAVSWLVVAAKQKAEELNVYVSKWEDTNKSTLSKISKLESEMKSSENSAWENLVSSSADKSVDLSSLPGTAFAVNIVIQDGETDAQAKHRTMQEFSQHYIGEIADWWYGLTDEERSLQKNKDLHIHYHRVWGYHYGKAMGNGEAGAYGASYGEMYAPQIKDQIIKNLVDEGYQGDSLKEELIKRIAAQAVAKAKAENASPYGKNLDLDIVRKAAENAVRWNGLSGEDYLEFGYGPFSEIQISAIKYWENNRETLKKYEGLTPETKWGDIDSEIMQYLVDSFSTGIYPNINEIKQLRLDLINKANAEENAPYTPPSLRTRELEAEDVWQKFSKSLNLGNFNSTHNAAYVGGRFEVYENKNTIDSADLHVRDAYVMNRIKAHIDSWGSIKSSNIKQFQEEAKQWSGKDIVNGTAITTEVELTPKQKAEAGMPQSLINYLDRPGRKDLWEKEIANGTKFSNFQGWIDTSGGNVTTAAAEFIYNFAKEVDGDITLEAYTKKKRIEEGFVYAEFPATFTPKTKDEIIEAFTAIPKFGEGLYDGIKDELSGIIDLLNPETYEALFAFVIELGKAVNENGVEILEGIKDEAITIIGTEFSEAIDNAIAKFKEANTPYNQGYATAVVGMAFFPAGKVAKADEFAKLLEELTGGVKSAVRATKFGGVTIRQGAHAGKVIKTWDEFEDLLLPDVQKHIGSGHKKNKVIQSDGNVSLTVTGGHSAKIDPSSVKIDQVTNTYRDGFYEAKVRIFDEDLYKMHENNPQIAKELKGWKLKSKSSTMFPDNWTQADIELNISQAWKNGVEEITDPDGRKHFIGKTDEGIPLEFAVGNNPPSVFANFASETWR